MCQFCPKPVSDIQSRPANGFTLIELMIVVAIIAIILTLALPVYTDYTIRAKIGEALSVSAAAKTSVSASCIEDPTISAIDSDNMGYEFEPSPYVSGISLSGPCSAPTITMQTTQTGASPDPVLTLQGQMSEGRMAFTCSSSGPNMHVPRECRS